MQIAIVHLPGSNRDSEIMLAVKHADMAPHEFLWNAAAEKLADFAGYIIMGEFSAETSLLDPVIQMIKAQSELGKPVLGIRGGAQILVETGMVPGVENNQPCITLNHVEDSNKFFRLSDHYQLNAFTRHLKPSDILQCPNADAKTRFVIPPALLMEMQIQGLNVFQYCDLAGKINADDNIAAVTNKMGNVMALIPHPANAHHIFRSMRDYIGEGQVCRVAPLNYYPRT